MTVLTRFMQLPVDRLMQPEVQSARPEAKASEVAAMMAEGYGSVPIVNEKGQLLGIVTEFDLLASLQEGHRWGEVTAGQIMTAIPCTVTPETDIATLVGILQSTHRIRVPVVEEGTGKLVGIIARRDIIHGYLNYLANAG